MEDNPDSIGTVIFFVIIYAVIPLIMIYRRGYLFNCDENLRWLKNIFGKNNAHIYENWTITKVRPLTAFEKYQIQKITVQFDPSHGEEYWAVITLKSSKTLKYELGENKGSWIDDVIHKDNILLRTWQKKNWYKYDVVPIKDNE